MLSMWSDAQILDEATKLGQPCRKYIEVPKSSLLLAGAQEIAVIGHQIEINTTQSFPYDSHAILPARSPEIAMKAVTLAAANPRRPKRPNNSLRTLALFHVQIAAIEAHLFCLKSLRW